MILGDSWCAVCDRHSEFELTGYNEPCECHDGKGKLWEIVSGLVCECGEPLSWMHQPPPEPLEWTIELPVRMPVASTAQEGEGCVVAQTEVWLSVY
jgi:hypothetical protein